ncbi:orotidine-5'-phosphate decarboxylase [Nitrospirota bacterium]
MNKLIMALDVSDQDYALELVDRLAPHVGMFKVGLELFTAAGPEVVRGIHERGSEVFLDLKFHDIPNTVASAAMAATRLGVYMFNVHASNGLKTMETVREAVTKLCLKENLRRPKLLAVTVLTSLSTEVLKGELCVHHSPGTHVKHLARLAHKAGMDGVVASGHEARMIRDSFGDDFMIVTPGVRPTWSEADDQERIVTPSKAVREGADFIVMGRSILRHDSPEKALEMVGRELAPKHP